MQASLGARFRIQQLSLLAATRQVVMAYTVALAVFIFAFWHSPDIAWVQWLAVAAVGAALYGPQVKFNSSRRPA